MVTIKGKIVGPMDMASGAVVVEDGRIAGIGRESGGGKVYDFGDCFVLPGFIDIHLHGLGEYEMFEAEAIAAAAEMEVRFGTCGFCPTAASLTEEQYMEFGRNVRRARGLAGENAAKIVGAHYEGPFINPARKGGMDAAFLRKMDAAECRRYISDAGDVLKMMTLSPELEGSSEVIKLLRDNNVVASLGHTLATPEELDRAVKAGANHVCHLFNTFMLNQEVEPGIIKPGLLVSILTNEILNCELICDMYHVRKEYIKLAAKMLGPDRFIAITDSLQGAGLEPGEYMLFGREFSTREGVGKLVSDGAVVGSVLTMDKAFGNLVGKCGFDPVTVAKFTAANAARQMGILGETGSLEVGKVADIAVLDPEYKCVATFVEGKMVYGNR